KMQWLLNTIGDLATDAVLVTPHWGPNMVGEPVPHVRATAQALRAAGVSLIAGHSAHVFHGVADRVLYDLGDFLDDYAVGPGLRNDLGLLFLVTFTGGVPERIEAIPVAIDRCHTRLARPDEARWITARFRQACSDLGTSVIEERGRLVIQRTAQ
ncbi:MAG: CapA family protein, partial [Acidimicrobiia bacterium]|nr:CapA family protein [Acidimicrobiia bacterium]